MTSQLHEDLSREIDEPHGSDRSFGFVFATVFALIALLPLLHGHALRLWALAPAAAFLILALAAPKVLAPLNRVWMAVGRLLNRIVSPVVMAVLFLVAVVPTGIVLKLTPRADPIASNAVGMLAGALILLPISFLLGEQWSLPAQPDTWAAMVYLVVPGSLAVFWLFVFVLRRWTASAVSFEFLLIPLATIPASTSSCSKYAEARPAYAFNRVVPIAWSWYHSSRALWSLG